MHDLSAESTVSKISLFLDEAAEPFATYRPPATVSLDTTTLADGSHTLFIVAEDTTGKVGRRSIPFIVQNGPGITVTGLRAGERVAGGITIDINAFGADEPFDPVRAESSGPIPVWTWVMSAIILGWAAWYGLEFFQTPAAFANTPTYEANPVAMTPVADAAAAPSGKGSAAGFDYGATGPQLYTQNCSACHGASGAGVPGAFPPLAGDPVVNAADAKMHVTVVLHGLQGKAIGGKSYSSQMPAFAQLSDADIAAIIDHERTSWGNHGAVITPSEVKSSR